jgi:amphi-Trp domain-containing protein
MVDAPETETEEPERRTITDGFFEEGFYVDAETAGEFLVELGEQLRDEGAVTITGDDWELPFEASDEVELEVEFEGDDDPELEIEIELHGAPDESAPDVL